MIFLSVHSSKQSSFLFFLFWKVQFSKLSIQKFGFGKILKKKNEILLVLK